MSSDAKAPANGPLSFMEKLSAEVLIHRPSPSSTSTSTATTTPPPPKLIIITSWSDALDLHIAKYVTTYLSIFPTSPILLIKSTLKLFFSPHLVKLAVQPAIPFIQSCLPSPDPSTTPPAESHSPTDPQLLIHVFSNGGISTLTHLLPAYAAAAASSSLPKPTATSTTTATLPAHIKILDSCPATVFDPSRLIALLNTALSLPLQLLTTPIIYPLAYTWGTLISLGVLTDHLGVWGRALNDREGVHATELRRAYIYSQSDVLVDFRRVEGHADEAEERGFEVKRYRFDGSGHVANVRVDGGRYWGVVKGVWDGDGDSYGDGKGDGSVGRAKL